MSATPEDDVAMRRRRARQVLVDNSSDPLIRDYLKADALAHDHRARLMEQGRIVAARMEEVEREVLSLTTSKWIHQRGFTDQLIDEVVYVGPQLQTVVSDSRVEECAEILLGRTSEFVDDIAYIDQVMTFAHPTESVQAMCRLLQRLVTETYAGVVEFSSCIAPAHAAKLGNLAKSLRQVLASELLIVTRVHSGATQVQREIEELQGNIEKGALQLSKACRLGRELLKENEVLRSQVFRSSEMGDGPGGSVENDPAFDTSATAGAAARRQVERGLVMLQVEGLAELRIKKPNLVSEALLTLRTTIEVLAGQHGGARTNYNPESETDAPFNKDTNPRFGPQSFVFSFSQPAKAVVFAADVQRTLTERTTWSKGLLELPAMAPVIKALTRGAEPSLVWKGPRVRIIVNAGVPVVTYPFASAAAGSSSSGNLVADVSSAFGTQSPSKSQHPPASSPRRGISTANVPYLGGMLMDTTAMVLQEARGGEIVITGNAVKLFDAIRFTDHSFGGDIVMVDRKLTGLRLGIEANSIVKSAVAACHRGRLLPADGLRFRELYETSFPPVGFWRQVEGGSALETVQPGDFEDDVAEGSNGRLLPHQYEEKLLLLNGELAATKLALKQQQEFNDRLAAEAVLNTDEAASLKKQLAHVNERLQRERQRKNAAATLLRSGEQNLLRATHELAVFRDYVATRVRLIVPVMESSTETDEAGPTLLNASFGRSPRNGQLLSPGNADLRTGAQRGPRPLGTRIDGGDDEDTSEKMHRLCGVVQQAVDVLDGAAATVIAASSSDNRSGYPADRVRDDLLSMFRDHLDPAAAFDSWEQGQHVAANMSSSSREEEGASLPPFADASVRVAVAIMAAAETQSKCFSNVLHRIMRAAAAQQPRLDAPTLVSETAGESPLVASGRNMIDLEQRLASMQESAKAQAQRFNDQRVALEGRCNVLQGKLTETTKRATSFHHDMVTLVDQLKTKAVTDEHNQNMKLAFEGLAKRFSFSSVKKKTDDGDEEDTGAALTPMANSIRGGPAAVGGTPPPPSSDAMAVQSALLAQVADLQEQLRVRGHSLDEERKQWLVTRDKDNEAVLAAAKAQLEKNLKMKDLAKTARDANSLVEKQAALRKAGASEEEAMRQLVEDMVEERLRANRSSRKLPTKDASCQATTHSPMGPSREGTHPKAATSGHVVPASPSGASSPRAAPAKPLLPPTPKHNIVPHAPSHAGAGAAAAHGTDVTAEDLPHDELRLPAIAKAAGSRELQTAPEGLPVPGCAPDNAKGELPRPASCQAPHVTVPAGHVYDLHVVRRGGAEEPLGAAEGPSHGGIDRRAGWSDADRCHERIVPGAVHNERTPRVASARTVTCPSCKLHYTAKPSMDFEVTNPADSRPLSADANSGASTADGARAGSGGVSANAASTFRVTVATSVDFYLLLDCASQTTNDPADGGAPVAPGPSSPSHASSSAQRLHERPTSTTGLHETVPLHRVVQCQLIGEPLPFDAASRLTSPSSPAAPPALVKPTNEARAPSAKSAAAVGGPEGLPPAFSLLSPKAGGGRGAAPSAAVPKSPEPEGTSFLEMSTRAAPALAPAGAGARAARSMLNQGTRDPSGHDDAAQEAGAEDSATEGLAVHVSATAGVKMETATVPSPIATAANVVGSSTASASPRAGGSQKRGGASLNDHGASRSEPRSLVGRPPDPFASSTSRVRHEIPPPAPGLGSPPPTPSGFVPAVGLHEASTRAQTEAAAAAARRAAVVSAARLQAEWEAENATASRPRPFDASPLLEAVLAAVDADAGADSGLPASPSVRLALRTLDFQGTDRTVLARPAEPWAPLATPVASPRRLAGVGSAPVSSTRLTTPAAAAHPLAMRPREASLRAVTSSKGVPVASAKYIIVRRNPESLALDASSLGAAGKRK